MSLQVKHAFNKFILSSIIRCSHTAPEPGVLYSLDKRALLRVRGTSPASGEASKFLQGLITNDMKHFEDGASCMYAMFLNTKGRVLYDTLVHASGDRDCFLLECDSHVISAVKNHLKVYKLKKKIEIDDLSEEYNIFTFIGSPDKKTDTILKSVKIHKDPRMQSLGSRIIAPAGVMTAKLSEALGTNVSIAEFADYKYLRYQLGVGEGVEDLPPGACIPLEANCDYLHGVSFHKGCYIGQELTARVHHTGIVRKRFMPFKFEKPPTTYIPSDSIVADVENLKSRVGKLRGVIKDYGLVLANISEALHAKSLHVYGHNGVVQRPSWWPIEASKEKAGAAKLVT